MERDGTRCWRICGTGHDEMGLREEPLSADRLAEGGAQVYKAVTEMYA